MLTDGCMDGPMDNGGKVISIAHPEHSSGEFFFFFFFDLGFTALSKIFHLY